MQKATNTLASRRVSVAADVVTTNTLANGRLHSSRCISAAAVVAASTLARLTLEICVLTGRDVASLYQTTTNGNRPAHRTSIVPTGQFSPCLALLICLYSYN